MKSERRKLGREERNIAYRAGVAAGVAHGRRVGYADATKHWQTVANIALLLGVLWLMVMAIPDCQQWTENKRERTDNVPQPHSVVLGDSLRRDLWVDGQFIARVQGHVVQFTLSDTTTCAQDSLTQEVAYRMVEMPEWQQLLLFDRLAQRSTCGELEGYLSW